MVTKVAAAMAGELVVAVGAAVMVMRNTTAVVAAVAAARLWESAPSRPPPLRPRGGVSAAVKGRGV